MIGAKEEWEKGVEDSGEEGEGDKEWQHRGRKES